MRIGVLALQGGFQKHANMLAMCGCDYRLVKTAEQLNQVDGLIIPGGESSALLNLIDKQGLHTPLNAFFLEKKTDIWHLCWYDLNGQ